MVVFCLLCRWMFRSYFVYDERTGLRDAPGRREAITDRRLLVTGRVVLSAVILAFVLHPAACTIEPAVVACWGPVSLLVTGVDPAETMRDVSGRRSRSSPGCSSRGGRSGGDQGDRPDRRGSVDVHRGGSLRRDDGSCSAGLRCCSAIVDNIPTSRDDGARWSLSWPPGNGESGQVLWWALSPWGDPGGNAASIGASANVVALASPSGRGQPIGFWSSPGPAS